MKIRKSFKFEMAHIVRDAYSRRCAKNIHWHSYVIEVFLEWKSSKLDKAGMIVDFGEIKNDFNNLIDRFDHSCFLWDKWTVETNEEIDFFKKHYERVIVANFNSSAEQQAQFFFNELKKINDKVCKVRLHETVTWFAEYSNSDFLEDWQMNYNIEYSNWIFNT